ncbi:hypothetical protein ACTMSW_29225 [Micromonospora sp. BQ11]|uniref:hypothetical protein n=1 Tax=Micromonospora sp. BQ11 TaxID=3452212 RepID=UPI003F88813C
MIRGDVTTAAKARVDPAGRGRRAAGLGLLLTAALALPLANATPALADVRGSDKIGPECEVNSNGVYSCRTYMSEWITNARDPQSLGTRGAHHNMNMYYFPNSAHQRVYVKGYAAVYDRTGADVDRMRMTQTYKALGIGGGTVSVAWGGVEVGEEGATVSAREVRLDMTRQDIQHMSRNVDLSFPRGYSAHSVEMVTNSTIEYPTTNRTYRLASAGRITDY